MRRRAAWETACDERRRPPNGSDASACCASLLPVAMLALGDVGLGPGGAAQQHSALCAARARGWCSSTLDLRLAVLGGSLLVTLTTTFAGAWSLAVVGGVGLAILFNQSRLHRIFALSLRRHPAGDADRGDRAAPAHLSAAACGRARLRLDRGVLPGARQHDARASNRSTTISSTCSGSTARRAGRCCATSSCRRRCPYMLGGLKIAGGLSLIGAVVAEIAAGTAGRGLRPCLSHRRIRAIASTSRACSPRFCSSRSPAS